MMLKILFELAKSDKRAAYLVERSEMQPSGCLEWQKSKIKYGYGNFRMGGRAWLAHRFSYELVYGDFPEELFVCHRCDNPSCVNSDHLFLGTVTDNNNDKMSKGRQAKGPAQVLTATFSKLRHPPAKENPDLPVGVTWLARLGKYRVQIGGTPRRHVGVYKTVEEAAAAYKEAVEQVIQTARENLV